MNMTKHLFSEEEVREKVLIFPPNAMCELIGYSINVNTV